MHFEVFKEEAQKWIDIIGLQGWEVDFKHEDTKKSTKAEIWYRVAGRWATLVLNKEWNEHSPPNVCEVRRSAFHEVCETLTSQLVALAESRFVSQDEISVANHYIIRILENFMLILLYIMKIKYPMLRIHVIIYFLYIKIHLEFFLNFKKLKIIYKI